MGVLVALVGLGGAVAGWSVGRLDPGSAASPRGTPVTVPDCTASSQPLIAAAALGATVVLPACIDRETLVVGKPLTLVGAPGAEIRGSDVWTGWQRQATSWVSSLTVPDFQVNGTCRPGTQRCRWPEQVFVDGSALEEVAPGTIPGASQFALDAARHVLLGSDPADHLLEVTTRTRWIEVRADGIVIAGLRMRDAANAAQEGAITDDGHAVTIRDCVMSDTHGAVVSLTGSGALIGNDIFRGGQLGVHGGGALVDGNRIHANNTQGFDWGWEAGGLKSNRPDQLIEGNEVYDNAGPGLWWDGSTGPIRILDNRIHDNRAAGILFEISTQGRLAGNRIWGNGLGDSEWGWGGGIVISSSAHVEVDHNVVAWNADGITVISQRREDAPGPTTDLRVHDNVIAGTDGAPDPMQDYALAWLQDWPGVLFASGSANAGTDNAVWYATPEGTTRFAWDGDLASLGAFQATPGGAGSRYLTAAEAARSLTAAEVPAAAP
jgi:parallel beta-helix repeat protein